MSFFFLNMMVRSGLSPFLSFWEPAQTILHHVDLGKLLPGKAYFYLKSVKTRPILNRHQKMFDPCLGSNNWPSACNKLQTIWLNGKFRVNWDKKATTVLNEKIKCELIFLSEICYKVAIESYLKYVLFEFNKKSTFHFLIHFKALSQQCCRQSYSTVAHHVTYIHVCQAFRMVSCSTMKRVQIATQIAQKSLYVKLVSTANGLLTQWLALST